MKIRNIQFKINAYIQMAKITQSEVDKSNYLEKVEELILELEDLEDEIRKNQNVVIEDNPQIEKIRSYCEGKTRVCAIEIWQEALGEQGRPAKWQATKINDIIASMPEWKKIGNATRFGKYGVQRGLERSVWHVH